MFSGADIESILADVGITHVIWIPDSTTGQWEADLESSTRLQLIRVCREGEAWAMAAGLLVGGRLPLVVIQTTGLFESGDALRNAVFDLKLPVLAIVGARNWLVPDSTDSSKRFARPILDGWGIPYEIVEREADRKNVADLLRNWKQAGSPGIILLGEGKE